MVELRAVYGTIRTELATLLVTISIVAAGCTASDYHPVISIDNQLDITVKITFLNPLGQEGGLVEKLPAHQAYSLDLLPAGSDRCTPAEMIARDVASGKEVARSPNPVCRPSVWTITSPGGS